MDIKEAYEKRRQECLPLQRQLNKAQKTIDELTAGTYTDKEKAAHLRTINRLTQNTLPISGHTSKPVIVTA